MTKKILIITILLISTKVSAQIDLEHVYDSNIICPNCTTQVRAFNASNKTFYYTSGKNGIFIFNSDHSLYKQILPEDETVGFDKIYFPSDKLFNNDNLIEFIVTKKNYKYEENEWGSAEWVEKKIVVMNENGETIKVLGQKDGELQNELEESERIKYLHTADNQAKIIVNCSDSAFVYNVSGQLTTNQLKTLSQEPLKVFPNPSQTDITINGDYLRNESIIKIFDINGGLMKTVSIDGKKNSVKIDITDLIPGVYIYYSGEKSGKFIKN